MCVYISFEYSYFKYLYSYNIGMCVNVYKVNRLICIITGYIENYIGILLTKTSGLTLSYNLSFSKFVLLTSY